MIMSINGILLSIVCLVLFQIRSSHVRVCQRIFDKIIVETFLVLGVFSSVV